MNRSDIIASHGYAMSVETPFMGHKFSRGVFDRDEMDIHYPVSARTGLAMSDLSLITDPRASRYDRETAMAHLSASRSEGSYMPQGLSDDELFRLSPPRYFNSDPVDSDLWRDYLARDVLPGMKDSEGERTVDNILNDEVVKNEGITDTEAGD